MFFHKFKKILILKKIKTNSFIKNFFNKNFFFLEKTNTIFILNFFNVNGYKNYIYNYCNFNISLFSKNINIYLKKKNYNNKKKYRFLYSFFNFLNFNYFKKSTEKYNNIIDFFFFPKCIIFFNIKKKKKIIFYLLKKKTNFILFSKFLILILIKIKNLKFINLTIKKHKYINFFLKKKFFLKNICKIHKNIINGNLTQCVISNIIFLKKKYLIKNINISFYNFFLYYKNVNLITYSPEFLLRNELNIFFTKPIAGTMDKNNIFQKLLKNKKELSEHLMLLDLSLNDTFKNNIKKILFKKIFFCEDHKNIYHIISEIYFKNYKKNFFQIIKELFPAGTVSGSPKYNSLNIINKIEKKNRFIYGGVYSYVNKQNIESCIIIRAKIFLNNNVIIESGAGITNKSLNLLEWLETIIKKKNFLK